MSRIASAVLFLVIGLFTAAVSSEVFTVEFYFHFQLFVMI